MHSLIIESRRILSCLSVRAAKQPKIMLWSAVVLLACCGLSGPRALAQSFAAKVDYPTASLPYSVAVGDFNSDGKPDLAVANFDSYTMSVLLNKGDGTFAAKVDYPTDLHPTSVAVGDFNSDGKLDLVETYFITDKVSIFLNNGNGTFAPRADYNAVTSPSIVAVGDFNADGKPDLAVADGIDTISIMLNNGDGAFPVNVVYHADAFIDSIAAGDFNSDGKLDLVVTSSFYDKVSVFLNNGNGTFAAKVDYPTGKAPLSVAARDFNADGRPDLAVANQDSDAVSILLNNGNGTFAAKVDYPTASAPFSVAVGDFNSDGKPDLVVANVSSNRVSVLLNNGNGTFAAKADYLTGTTPHSVAVGDFNADGKLDIVVANVNNDTVSVLLNLPPNATGGHVNTPDGSPLPGVVIQLSGASSARTITDAAGSFRFTDLEIMGFYTVTPLMTDYTFGPSSRSFSLTADRTDATFTATPNAVITANPLDAEMYFVRQQYLDFLGREPDPGGLIYWSNEISRCGTDQTCINSRRIGISAAFFIEQEYQQTGSFVYRLYEGALGRRVSYAEFSADRQKVIAGSSLDQSKSALADSFVHRTDFLQKYEGATTAESFVNALILTIRHVSGADISSQRNGLINKYNTGSNRNESRSLALREAIDNESFKEAEYNPSFVLMEYFGYLNRDPEEDGYQFWLNVLDNKEPGNYRGMVCSFITSAEYQRRFAAVVSHTNQECK
jgi:hypothetical protein